MKKLFLLNIVICLFAFTMGTHSFSAHIHTDQAEITTPEKGDITLLLCDSKEQSVSCPLSQNPDQEHDLRQMIELLNQHEIFKQYRIHGGLMSYVNHGIKAKALANDNNAISFNQVRAVIEQAQSNAKNLSSVSTPQKLTPEQIFPTKELDRVLKNKRKGLVHTCNSQRDQANMYPLDVYTRCTCYAHLTPSQKTMFQEKLLEEQETEMFIQRLRQLHHNDSQQDTVIHRDTAIKIFKKIQELSSATDIPTNHQSSESDQTPATSSTTSIPVSPKSDSPSHHTQTNLSPRVKTNNHTPVSSPTTAVATPQSLIQQSTMRSREQSSHPAHAHSKADLSIPAKPNTYTKKAATTPQKNTFLQAPDKQPKTDNQSSIASSPVAAVIVSLGILTATHIIYQGVKVLHKKLTSFMGKKRSRSSLATQSSIPNPSAQA